ncbi:polysaccharide deacetylase family protein [Planktothrix sp. FACHB-1365]|uniref:polysaccharide deacetylase family protein n=1 Tax=Planktothrix sp. FACHB-1365 TaxID=2692855 RepID=UPI001684B272|nr:polysaccharide deacetylase family protein [Planktothrix sp. FACHB-1365]MBD2481305.1 polysaccharide deacetylase family protein [Planktothrix sp. FACHB-1365]
MIGSITFKRFSQILLGGVSGIFILSFHQAQVAVSLPTVGLPTQNQVLPAEINSSEDYIEKPTIPPLGEPAPFIPRQPFPPPTLKKPEKPYYSLIPERYKGKTVNHVSPRNQEKVIALTFDDGPWLDTLKVLVVLQQFDIKATFFILGRNLVLYPEIIQQVVQGGHAVGNHTWTHPYVKMESQQAKSEIENTAAKLQLMTGLKTRLFRPPGGILDNGTAEYARSKNYAIIMWSIDTKDYQQASAEILAERVLNQARPGDIVLMHDGGGNRFQTIEALKMIIPELQKRGYRFVTVPELLALSE